MRSSPTGLQRRLTATKALKPDRVAAATVPDCEQDMLHIRP